MKQPSSAMSLLGFSIYVFPTPAASEAIGRKAQAGSTPVFRFRMISPVKARSLRQNSRQRCLLRRRRHLSDFRCC